MSSGSTAMKKNIRRKRQRRTTDEMRAEYRFDHAKAKPNRFASRMEKGVVAVILDPDVASVFHSSDAVNTFLRSVIATMPKKEQKRVKTAQQSVAVKGRAKKTFSLFNN